MIVPCIPLGRCQLISKIIWKFGEPVCPGGRRLFEPLKFVDGHQNMSPATTMRYRDRITATTVSRRPADGIALHDGSTGGPK